ncbi:molybdopterin molybdotransferase MoeA [Methylobacterium haplocladii]|uniref:Molybdopterin molybdenumtransferase n=1 Tax=Methylobacterium haplocladii TaxID=1176176 RepID=A0A512ITE9_9HYPH|nr:gephyrin-like molybdotransferase Glp [Methylobacterium haplocladii]GEP00977.1 molybdopterin molybdenumtransferase MoeA [Methylobacterium haplocladii]GJD84935.1 Molybdopterin molybdenumtransferase [Methylobacterium haplocladii]GLS58323.1 molybdopterin molybdenumtransferase MoeA [Methylobacterium haplocladii]
MSGLISVAEALARILASVPGPVEAETVALAEAHGRTLAADIVATRTQPPFPASAMDGYAVRAVDLATVPVSLRLVGISAAGHGFSGSIGPGDTVRTFTGAPVPDGADAILIQEDADAKGETVTARESVTAEKFIRPAGLDFRDGDVLMRAGETLDARRLALAAASGHAMVGVRRRPRVAILATGDELVRPGEAAAWDQIVASNGLAVASLAREAGADPIDLGIAGDDLDSLKASVGRARDAGADLLITLGGASVGDHDLVQRALSDEGMELGFWRVALRPGKPLMHGRLGPMLAIGLPGNPVSSIVCGLLFVVPAIRALLGDPHAGADRSEPATLGRDMAENDKRQDYLRAHLDMAPDRVPIATPETRQDSSMLAVLGRSEALLIREPHAPAARKGDPCRIIRLDRRII